MEYRELTKEDFTAAAQNGISAKNLRQRVWDYGWEIDKAITTPLKKRDLSTWNEWKGTCRKNGIYNELFNLRLKYGWTPEQAATTPRKTKGE